MTLEEAVKGGPKRPVVTDDDVYDAAFNADRGVWLKSAQTQHLFEALEQASKSLDAAAKALAVLDEQPYAARIRGLLIESNTIKKVLDYANRRTRTDKYPIS